MREAVAEIGTMVRRGFSPEWIEAEEEQEGRSLEGRNNYRLSSGCRRR